ncbi:MAG: branched-chain amino acid ABC transporter permease [Fimbriimonas sp.]|nr:branched-chain amino acid ABC transporter permease [Fimbriimonas sp.]
MNFWLIRVLSILGAIAGCAGLQVVAGGQSDYIQRLLILAGLYVTLSVSLNLINGITGQFSIGHAAFYQVGAYMAGFCSVHYFKSSHLPPLVWLVVTMVVAAIAAAGAGFVVGLPSLRLRGDYLAIVTLGFGEIIRIQVQNTPALGGSYGMNIEPKVQSIALVWLLAVLCVAVCRNLLKTASGLPFLAVREDEVASSAMGVNVTRAKVTAFVLGSAFAGSAGALLASYEGFITPATFGMDVSFIILTMVVLGGTGSITGSIFAAVFLTLLPEYLRGLKDASGGPLTLTGGTVVAWMIGVIFAVAVLRHVYEDAKRSRLNRLCFGIGGVVVGLIVQAIASVMMNKIGALHDKIIMIGQLRMAIFAVTLIVLMLLRPQGVFAHHEFSWDWVGRLIGRRRRATV